MILATFAAWLTSSIAFVHYERHLSEDSSQRVAERIGIALLAIGAVLTAGDIATSALHGRMPFSDSQSAMMGLAFAWVLIGISFIIIMRVTLLGIIVAPLGTLMAGFVLAAPLPEPSVHAGVTEIREIAGILLHAILGYGGYSAFLAAALGAGLFLLLDRELRLKRLGTLCERLPSLERSAEIIRIGIKSGLYLFFFAILSAMTFLRGFVTPKELLFDSNIHAIIAVSAYSAVLYFLGSRKGWSRPPVVLMTFLLGFFVIAIHVLLIFGASFHSFES